jgi:5-methylcytosine-specific restriction protein A
MELIDSKEQIAANVSLFDTYRDSSRDLERSFYRDLLRRGKIFVCLRIGEQAMFCPSRFAGYESNTRPKHLAFEGKHGTDTTRRIDTALQRRHARNATAESEYLSLCERLGIAPSKKQRTYWVIEGVTPPPPRRAASGAFGFPDEVAEAQQYLEGAVKSVLVNAYERNPQARQACIDYYGVTCAVCGFDFELTYGTIGRGFIHVHHIKPLCARGSEYSIDPIEDLRPVCPNCHAMLHTSDPPFSIEELMEVVSTRRSSRPNKPLHRTRHTATRR